MNNRELDAKMAELIGWKIAHDPIENREFYYPLDEDPEFIAFDYYIDEWKPSTDIAAAMQVEDRIEELGLEETYIKRLIRLMGISGPYYDQLFFLVHASPEDRCHAALKAVEDK